jgi:hypothetical protein
MNIYHLARNEVIHREENAALVVIAIDEYAARERAADLCGPEGVAPWLERADCVQVGVALPEFDAHGFACVDCLEA